MPLRRPSSNYKSITSISEIIEANHTSLQNQSNGTISILKKCIDDCSQTVRELKDLNDPLERKVSDSKLRKAWRSVVTIKKEHEIALVLSWIEIVKSNLVQCFSSQNL